MRAPGWWSVPSFRNPSYAEQGHIAYAILRAGTLVSAGMLVAAPFVGHTLRSSLNYALLLALHIASLIVLRRGYVHLAVRAFCVAYFALITVSIIQFGGMRCPAGFVYPVLVVVAGLMWSTQAAIGFGLACALAGLAVVLLERANLVPGVSVSIERTWTAMVAVIVITAMTLHVAMSALRRARSEALELQAQLDRSERFEALGRLAAGVAHDFNNQLTAILANIAALRGADDPAERDASIQGIESATLHAAELTRQLLEFGRKRVLEPRVVAVSEVVLGLHNLIAQSLGPHTALRTCFENDTLDVRIDRTALERVLVNLILNARDAMPEGGDVVLRARHLRPPQHERDAIEISVKDQGTGMDEATRSRIFEPFFTTKPKGRGTGLGLSSVLGVIAQSGGEIAVESEPGQGSTFRIFLPAAEPALENGERSSRPD